jgi:hypothetical protein
VVPQLPLKDIIMKYVALALAMTAVACAAPAGDEEETGSNESAATAASWQAIYRCDDGSVLDINTNERREFQFVIRNDAAKKLLMKSADVNYFDWNISPSGEVVYRGRLERGVFYKHDFSYGIGISGKPKVQVGDQWGPTAEIRRNGSDITVVANDYYNWTFRNCR